MVKILTKLKGKNRKNVEEGLFNYWYGVWSGLGPALGPVRQSRQSISPALRPCLLVCVVGNMRIPCHRDMKKFKLDNVHKALTCTLQVGTS